MTDQQPEQAELDAVPVDGELYKADDLTGGEQRELRNTLRHLTGVEDGTLVQFLDLGYGVDDFDIVSAMTYVVKRRTDPEYTLEQALQLKPAEVAEEARKLSKKRESRRRPRTAAGGES